ncbi:MAG: YfhO family protein, partial [Oscillospiraceae bacterium]|nr:YfhO family protein [Oscillospiraceae bacterium]
YQVLDVPRSRNTLTDWNFLFFGNEQRYGLLLESFFFPPEIAARNEMFKEANAKWSSVALYLPLFSMAGVLAFFKGRKGHWIKPLLLLCLLFAFVPGLNSSFTMFNNNYYTRWFYMPSLICCLATAYVIDDERSDLKFGVTATAIATTIIGGLALLAPFTKEVTVDGTKIKKLIPRFIDISYYPLWIAMGIAFATIIVLALLVYRRKKQSNAGFVRDVTVLTVVFSMILGYYFIGSGRSIGPKMGRFNKMVSAKFNIDDPDFYRIEGLDETNNVNMFWGMSSLKSFTSIIPGSTFELYDLLGISRTVNSAPDHDRYAFRALSRVKYLMVPEDMTGKSKALEKLEIYEKIDTQGIYDIYKTDYALPMGFAYDDYYLEKDVKDNKKVDNLMVRAAILKEDQAEKYADILNALDPLTTGNISVDEFKEDAQNRIDSGVLRFSINKTGFTAMSNYDTEKLVCFSVPWCKGWSATVNGEPVEVDKINGGFCAIRVPEGVGEISFTYETPGLRYGIMATGAGAVMLGIYVLLILIVKRKNGRPYAHLYDRDQISGVKGHKSYIGQLSDQIYNCHERGGNVTSDQVIEFPNINESFMDTEKYDFSKRKPKERNSHITEDDEAYRVMEELDKQRDEDD